MFTYSMLHAGSINFYSTLKRFVLKNVITSYTIKMTIYYYIFALVLIKMYIHARLHIILGL